MSLNALYSGASGLAANSSALDVIGQNLANLNTTGFKTETPNFSDLVYQTLNAGTGPSASSGGVNPVQTGSGVQMGSVGTDFSQGNVTSTTDTSDAAIQGAGFFVVSNGATTSYTRAGSFSVDAAGYLDDPATGYRLQRTGSVGEPTATVPGFQTPGNDDIKIPFGAGLAGVKTTTVNYQGNISSSLTVGQSATTAIQVYDSQGTAHTLNVTFTNTATNAYSVSATVSGGTATLTTNTVTFDQNGLIQAPTTLAVAITGLSGAANQTVNLNLGTAGQTTGITQLGGSSTAAAVTQDGSGYGTLSSFSYDQSGNVIGQFSNGATAPLAQLAIAGFNNPGGLTKLGNNYYGASAASGQALVGVANTGGLGTVQGSALEGSNVDVATQFSQLIIAQRGYQINAQTITVVNEVLQTLTNIIR